MLCYFFAVTVRRHIHSLSLALALYPLAVIKPTSQYFSFKFVGDKSIIFALPQYVPSKSLELGVYVQRNQLSFGLLPLVSFFSFLQVEFCGHQIYVSFEFTLPFKERKCFLNCFHS